MSWPRRWPRSPDAELVLAAEREIRLEDAEVENAQRASLYQPPQPYVLRHAPPATKPAMDRRDLLRRLKKVEEWIERHRPAGRRSRRREPSGLLALRKERDELRRLLAADPPS